MAHVRSFDGRESETVVVSPPGQREDLCAGYVAFEAAHQIQRGSEVRGQRTSCIFSSTSRRLSGSAALCSDRCGSAPPAAFQTSPKCPEGPGSTSMQQALLSGVTGVTEGLQPPSSLPAETPPAWVGIRNPGACCRIARSCSEGSTWLGDGGVRELLIPGFVCRWSRCR